MPPARLCYPARMQSLLAKLAITLGAAGIAVANLVWPETLNAVTLGCLAVAVLPWLGQVFRSIELPSGLKVEYHDVKRVEKAAEQVGLLPTNVAGTSPVGEKPLYARLLTEDANLALAGLRIEIERSLEGLAARAGLKPQRRGVGSLMRELQDAGALTPQEQSVLADMTGLLNQAVHGAEVSESAARWAIEVGPQLLESLDRKNAES